MATSPIDHPITPLRQRMQHDIVLRGLGSHTQKDYIRHVRRFAAFLKRPPDTATAEDVRRFQLYQHENGVGAPTINSRHQRTCPLLTHLLDISRTGLEQRTQIAIRRFFDRFTQAPTLKRASTIPRTNPEYFPG